MALGPLNVLIVHGIGNHPKEFASVFERELSARVRHDLERLADVYHLPRRPPSDVLNIIPGRWASVAEGVQRIIEGRILRGPADFLRWFGMRFMGDVIAYQGQAVHEEIHRALTQDLRAHLRPESGHVSIIAHSLGAVIASNFVYDHTQRIDRRFAEGFGVAFCNFFTLGSPLALYATQAAHDGNFDVDRVLDHFDRPVRVESETGVWVNVFDEGDIIGYPIKSLNQCYSEAVTADVCVDVGDFWHRGSPLSHGRYWADPRVTRIIAEKLAIDAAHLHMGLEGADLRAAVSDYVGRLGTSANGRSGRIRRSQVMNLLAQLATG